MTLLLIPRLHLKTEILLNQLRDKFPEPEKIDRVSVVRGHVVERFAFKSRLALLVHSLQVGFVLPHNIYTIVFTITCCLFFIGSFTTVSTGYEYLHYRTIITNWSCPS